MIPKRAIATTVALLASSILLMACEAATEVQAQADAAAAAFEREIGAKPFVAWNVNNGNLQSVNFIFDGDKITQRKIGDMENRAVRIVATSFKMRPAQVMVSARWEG
jgi:hypothetical protein